MPIYITPQKVKMRQLNGNNSDQFYGLDVVAAETTAEQVAAINNAVNEVEDRVNDAVNTATTNINTAITNANSKENELNSKVTTIQNALTSLKTSLETSGVEFPIDTTLTISGAAADAKAIGDAISNLKSAVQQFRSNEIKDITGNEIIQNWVTGYYETGSSKTSVDVNTIKPNSAWVCTYTSCSPGDIFYYTGYGNTSARSWAFLDINGDILPGGRASAGTYTTEKITAPAESTTVIFNANVSFEYYVIAENLLVERVEALESDSQNHTENITNLSNALDTLFDQKTITGDGEIFDVLPVINDVSVSGATSVIMRNSQIFEAKYPGTSGKNGVSITKNDDDTYTIDGLCTGSVSFRLDQSTRDGTDNPVVLDGTYSMGLEIVSGTFEKVTYAGSTPGILFVRDFADNTIETVTLGSVNTNGVFSTSTQNATIGFAVTKGVRYNNLRIAITVNKGATLLPRVKYVAPETYTTFDTLIDAAKRCAPNLWIIADPPTAVIIITGKVSKDNRSDNDGGNTYLYDVLEKYNDRIDILAQMFTKPLFLVYTDIHGNDTNLKRIDTWYIKNKPVHVSDVYCLGDMVQDQASDPITQFDDIEIWAKTLRVIGNHDVLASGTIPGITSVAAYEKYIAPVVADWDVTQPDDAATYGKNYYYKDYANKVRVIVLDTYFYTTDQHNWFVSTLENARTNNLAVIVAEHEDICTASEKQPLNADYPFARKYDGYTGLQYRTYGDGGNYETKRAAVDTFIGNGGTFICWLVGHQHADMTGTYNGGTNGKQLSVNLSNASNSMISSIRINNYSQDCFTYLGVDTDAHYLYLLRIGEAVDKWFHQNLFLCYDYVNHTVVEYH